MKRDVRIRNQEALRRYYNSSRLSKISRRDFLNGMGIAIGGSLLPGSGMGMVKQLGKLMGTTGTIGFDDPNGNPTDVIKACHTVRQGKNSGMLSNGKYTDPVEYDLAIVGGGLSGLAAARFYKELAGRDVRILILDNHTQVGGISRRNRMEVNGRDLIAAQGSCYVTAPEWEFVKWLYDDIGINLRDIEIPDHPGGVMFDEESHGVPHQWILRPWGIGIESFPIPFIAKKQIVELAVRMVFFYDRPDWKQELARLDTMTLQEHIENDLGYDHEVTRFYSIECMDIMGLEADAISAAAFYWLSGGREGEPEKHSNGSGNLQNLVSELRNSEFMPSGGRIRLPGKESKSSTGMFMFPGGNEGFARLILRRLIPAAVPYGPNLRDIIMNEIVYDELDKEDNDIRLRLGSTVTLVSHVATRSLDTKVQLKYLKDGEENLVYAKSVILAGGGYMTKNIVSNLPNTNREGLSHFYYSPYVVANVFVNNTRAAENVGFGWYGLYFDGLGCTISVADGILDSAPRNPNRPNVYTLWSPLRYPGYSAEEQGQMGRAFLHNATFEELESQVLDNMVRLLGPEGFSPENDVEGVFINRWGHSMLTVYPGFAFNRFSGGEDPVKQARQQFDLISFANTDMNGTPYVDAAIREALRAVGEQLGLL